MKKQELRGPDQCFLPFLPFLPAAAQPSAAWNTHEQKKSENNECDAEKRVDAQAETENGNKADVEERRKEWRKRGERKRGRKKASK